MVVVCGDCWLCLLYTSDAADEEQQAAGVDFAQQQQQQQQQQHQQQQQEGATDLWLKGRVAFATSLMDVGEIWKYATQRTKPTIATHNDHFKSLSLTHTLPLILLPSGEFERASQAFGDRQLTSCLLYTSPCPRDQRGSRMPSSA